MPEDVVPLQTAEPEIVYPGIFDVPVVTATVGSESRSKKIVPDSRDGGPFTFVADPVSINVAVPGISAGSPSVIVDPV